MKRSGPMKRTAMARSSGPLRARSAKMQQAYEGPDGRRVLVARLLIERPVCEARTERCTGQSVDVHELLARSAGGSITDEDNCICVCRECHQWIGDKPLEASRLGLRRSRYEGRNR